MVYVDISNILSNRDEFKVGYLKSEELFLSKFIKKGRFFPLDTDLFIH